MTSPNATSQTQKTRYWTASGATGDGKPFGASFETFSSVPLICSPKMRMPLIPVVESPDEFVKSVHCARISSTMLLNPNVPIAK